MKHLLLSALLLLTFCALAETAVGQQGIPEEITTPESAPSRIGELAFPSGYPTDATALALADELDYLHGVEAFMNSLHGVSLVALRRGFAAAGVQDNEFVIFPTMMDSSALFLTANADTIYFWGNLNLGDGPLVVETPPMVLGIFDDFWFRWISDFGLAGPDKGAGGRFLLLPPGYDGPVPEGGYFVCRSQTVHVTMLFRAFLEDDDPAPAVERVKSTLKLYPYRPGSHGTSVAAYLAGEAPLVAPAEATTPRIVDATDLRLNTIPPVDFGHYELVDELVQMEPASALDPELAGQFAAIGIVKGEEFAPDERLRGILEEAAAVGNAAARTLGLGAHPRESYRYYEEDSAWWNMLFTGGYEFEDPPPSIGADGSVTPSEPRGARQLHARSSFFYTATGTTPAMCMYLTGVGSQYLMAMLDDQGSVFDGAGTYQVTLPPDIPAERFWSLTVYDTQTRSMLQTPQRFPRAGSQGYPTPAASAAADGTTTITFSPERPEGVPEGNWIQTDPERGWFVMLRLYSPGQAFFDRSWRIGEVTRVR